MTLTAMWPDAGVQVLQLPQHREGIVGAAVVHEDDFVVAVTQGLVDQVMQFTEALRLVEQRDHEGQPGDGKRRTRSGVGQRHHPAL